MPRGRPRTSRRTSRRSRTSPDNGIIVKLAILGDGVNEQCIQKGSTVGDLFAQADREMGETVRMGGNVVDFDTPITRDGAVITSTSAVKGGRTPFILTIPTKIKSVVL